MESTGPQVFTENSNEQDPSSPPLDPITLYTKDCDSVGGPHFLFQDA